MDPNNQENDISGGSFNAEAIFNCFREAFQILNSRIWEVANAENPKDDPYGDSVLGPLFGGDYTSFVTQRERLLEIHKTPKPTSQPSYHWSEWA